MYTEFAEDYKQFSSMLVKGSGLNVPIEAHLENEKGKHFVLRGKVEKQGARYFAGKQVTENR